VTGKLYRVRPLEWVQTRDADHKQGECWKASTVLGSLHVGWVRAVGFRWLCHLSAYHDCESIVDGKVQAEAFYLGRILAALEEVT
jgi:hypothetical protein